MRETEVKSGVPQTQTGAAHLTHTHTHRHRHRHTHRHTHTHTAEDAHTSKGQLAIQFSIPKDTCMYAHTCIYSNIMHIQ